MIKVIIRLLCCCLVQLPLGLAGADEAPFKEEVLRRLPTGGQDAAPTLAGQAIHAGRFIGRMYQANGHRPIWNKAGIKALSSALDALAADGLNPADYRFPQIEPTLTNPDPGAQEPARAVEMDILLSETFLRVVYNLYFGKADPERLDPDINFARELEAKDLAPDLLAAAREGRIEDAFDWARPKNERYVWMKQALARYRGYQTDGGWQPIPEGKTLKPGESDPRAHQLRNRLAITGDLPPGGEAGPEPELYNPILQNAVESFQRRHGLEADGIVGQGTLAALNVPVEQRIDQIRVNLERQRWVMHEAYDEFMVVDIAGFKVYWVKDRQVIWSEQVQVGKAFTHTPVFKDRIRYLEFNPTWTIPPGILRRSILPGLKKDPGYLNKKGYLLLTQDGKQVDPKAVDWNALKGFPYIVRQPAGPDNALGLVKFLFPNPHLVYLHDTNHRELFDRTSRTFSSGCIRVRNPFDLAERLLEGQGDWNRARIDQVVASGKTLRVNLEQPLRIIIVYGTARAEDGRVHFRPDIYQRDAAVLAALDGEFRVRRKDLAKRPKDR